jgi:hypothetical protein
VSLDRHTVRAVFFGRIALIAALSVGASVARTVLGGQDLNFDLVTYHYYLGYSAFAQRLSLDFLPASFQGYQPPWPYVLLYLLDSAGVPPIVNAALHASIHALNLVLLFLLTESLVGAIRTIRDRVMVVALWLLGAVAPIYWYLVGTSFADLMTSVPVLAGLYLVARALPDNGQVMPARFRWIAIGAALAGAATGVRIHNAIYVAGLMCAVAFARYPHPIDRLRAVGVLSLAALSGWLLCFIPWAQGVYREFGNPLFPFFNGVFRSPDFPASNLPLSALVPDNLWDLVTLPFRMGTYAIWVYAETTLPDVRPGLLVVGLAACGFLWLISRIRAPAITAAPDARPVSSAERTAQGRRAIGIFFAASAILWLATSNNARYGVALFLLGGPVCGAVLARLLPLRHVILVVAAVLVWQASLQALFFRQYRLQSMPWTDRYFDWNLPSRAETEPAIFLSFGFKTASTLAPRVHPDSRHVNLMGQHTPTMGGPGSDRIRRIIGLPHRRIYGAFDFYITQQDVPGATSIKTYLGGHLHLWGLDFSDENCELISLRPSSVKWTWINRITGIEAHRAPPMLILCELRPSSLPDQQRALEEFRGFAMKLERFGAACPEYFAKPLTYTRVYRRWIVSSLASFEVTLDLEDEGPFYLQQMRPPYVVLRLGSVTHDKIVAVEPDCRKWFSILSQTSAQVSRSPVPE